MKLFDSLRLAAYLIAGAIGLVVLLRGCLDTEMLSSSAQEDYLVLTSTFEKKVSRGRFQFSGREIYVYGLVESSGVGHEMSAFNACRHISCEGLKENLSVFASKNADTIRYRVPIWSADEGRVIAPRKPGDKAVAKKHANGIFYVGLLIVCIIITVLLLRYALCLTIEK